MKSKLQAFVLLSISLCAAFIICARRASAQTHRASVRGTIYDPNGAVVPGATVRLTSEATGETREVRSGEDGEYALASLLPGVYRLEFHGQRVQHGVPQD